MTDARHTPKAKIDKVCAQCHGSMTFEGWISWDVESQRFEVDEICDKGHHCKTCNGDTHHIDVEYRPLSLQVSYDGNPEHTYTFNSQRELRSFREGLQARRGADEFEIVYTDEENDDDDD